MLANALEPGHRPATTSPFVDGERVAEGDIERTCTVGYSMDETFDIGWDKGSPVSDDYGPNAQFTGRVIKVDMNVHPTSMSTCATPKSTPRGGSPTR